MSEEQELTEKATLGGGCFWCLEAVYKEVDGVCEVASGYAGGTTENPTYRDVCSGTTGHAEVVEITYDPARISYRRLLEIFFSIHDPTTLNRQGNDVGTQYRSVIFYHTPEQQSIARAYIDELESAGTWDDPVVTELTPAPRFYPAEEVHDDYFARNPYQPYCRLVIAPKVAKFRDAFASELRG